MTTEKIPDSIKDQVLDNREKDFTYNMLHKHADIYDVQTKRDIIVPYESYVNKYRHSLDGIIVSSELSDAEKRAYWYKPKTVSFELYGNAEFWYTLLILNQCTSVNQFTPNVMKYYDPNYFKDYLNHMMILEDFGS